MEVDAIWLLGFSAVQMPGCERVECSPSWIYFDSPSDIPTTLSSRLLLVPLYPSTRRMAGRSGNATQETTITSWVITKTTLVIKPTLEVTFLLTRVVVVDG